MIDRMPIEKERGLAMVSSSRRVPLAITHVESAPKDRGIHAEIFTIITV